MSEPLNPYFLEETARAVDYALEVARNEAEFVSILEGKGYRVRMGGKARTVTFTTPDGFKVRNRRLFGKTKNDCSTEGIYKKLGIVPPEAVKLHWLGFRFFDNKEAISDFCKIFGIEEKDHRYIYVLGLQDGCFYVGQTGHFKSRMKRHFVSYKSGSIWTKLHVPETIIEITDMGSMEEADCALYESAKTIEYMERFGISKVRGGDFCTEEDTEIARLLYTHGYIVKRGRPLPDAIWAERYCDAIDELKHRKMVFQAEQIDPGR